jgi:hypothetical protein
MDSLVRMGSRRCGMPARSCRVYGGGKGAPRHGLDSSCSDSRLRVKAMRAAELRNWKKFAHDLVDEAVFAKGIEP